MIPSKGELAVYMVVVLSFFGGYKRTEIKAAWEKRFTSTPKQGAPIAEGSGDVSGAAPGEQPPGGEWNPMGNSQLSSEQEEQRRLYADRLSQQVNSLPPGAAPPAGRVAPIPNGAPPPDDSGAPAQPNPFSDANMGAPPPHEIPGNQPSAPPPDMVEEEAVDGGEDEEEIELAEGDEEEEILEDEDLGDDEEETVIEDEGGDEEVVE